MKYIQLYGTIKQTNKQIRKGNVLRINKYIASAGLCSRRKAEEFINNGEVTINGKIAELSDKIGENDKVKVKGKLITPESKTVTLAYNKPVGIECTADLANENNIISAINYPLRLFNVGRLDKDSEGLILLTNDGDLCYKLTKASELHEKEYIVTVNKPISAGFIHKMSNGVEILDTKTAPCKVKQVGTNKFRIILVQGLNRQIRRMTEALGYKVTSLVRLRIDNLTLSGLKVGAYKELSKKEITKLFNV